MKKILLTLLSTLFTAVGWSAAYDPVSVDLNDGTKVDIALSDNLSLSFNETHLLVSGSDADCEIPKGKIVSFTHLESSGLTEVAKDGSVGLAGRSMHFKGLADGSLIALYDLGGKCLRSVSAQGDYVLGLENLPSGVYVVTVNNVSYKISLK